MYLAVAQLDPTVPYSYLPTLPLTPLAISIALDRHPIGIYLNGYSSANYDRESQFYKPFQTVILIQRPIRVVSSPPCPQTAAFVLNRPMFLKASKNA